MMFSERDIGAVEQTTSLLMHNLQEFRQNLISFTDRNMKNHKKGFTLTEVLLVSAMFAVISLAVFNAFSNGFKLWSRGQHVMLEGDTAIFLDRMSKDLRQATLISGISFKGIETDIAFPAIIWGATDPNGSRAKEEVGLQVGAIRYVFDAAEKKIYRYQASYGQALKSQWVQPVEVANLIDDISLRYYFKADRGLNIKDETEQGIPLGVMVDVQFTDEGQVYHMRRFMIIPVGGGI